MRIDYKDGVYVGTLKWSNGSSTVYGDTRWDVIQTLLKKRWTDYSSNQPHVVEEPEPVRDEEPTFRYDEEAWTSDDWERDFRRDEIIGMHKDDDKI